MKVKNKWGYIDGDGKEIIPCIYDSDFAFKDGYAVVYDGNKYGVIDKHGNQICPFIYDYISYQLYIKKTKKSLKHLTN